MQSFKHHHLIIHFDEDRCCHTGECVQGLPQVFDPERDPWIEPSAARPAEIVEVIRRCPSGALNCEMAH